MQNDTREKTFLSTIWNLQYWTLIVVIFLMIACRNQTRVNRGTVKDVHKASVGFVDSIATTIVKGNYSVMLTTFFSNETIDVIDSKEDIYTSPVILYQSLSFFNRDKLLKVQKLPLNFVMKKTTGRSVLKAVQTPIYKMCVIESGKGVCYYLLNGSDYCNGSECPEFTGIYTLTGENINWVITPSLDKVAAINKQLSEYEIDLTKQDQCIDLELFK